MKNQIKQTLGLLTASLIITFTACKKSGTDDKPAETAKTLNKTTLTNNTKWHWEGQSADIDFEFHPNGTFGGANQGSWRWVGKSDTMEIDDDGTGYIKWKFYYNTETEMKCRRIDYINDMIFTRVK